MTGKQIQEIMKIVRPAIVALFGRQVLRIEKYKDSLAYRNKPGVDLFLEVGSYRYDEAVDGMVIHETYLVHLENNQVTSLGRGKLNL